MSKFDQDVPQFLDDFFKHMTTLSVRDLIKKFGGTQSLLSNFMKAGSFKNRKQSSAGSDMPELKLQRHYSTNPFLRHTHDEMNLMKRQLTFHNLIVRFDELDLHYLIKSFTLLS